MFFKAGLTGAVVSLALGTHAYAQQLNSSVADYAPSMFSNCYAGNDLAVATGINNPLLLMGSLTYFAETIQPNGSVAKGWVREPLALPIFVPDNTNPDQTTCAVKFEAATTGSLSVMGLSLSASRGEVYSVTVRLISRQEIATVVEGQTQVPAYRAAAYHGAIASIMSSIPAGVDQFFVANNISIYLVQIERYKRGNGSGSFNFGVFTAGGNYSRDESFSGTKIIVTGNMTPLYRANYIAPPAPIIARNESVLQLAPGVDVTEIQRRLQQMRGDSE